MGKKDFLSNNQVKPLIYFAMFLIAFTTLVYCITSFIELSFNLQKWSDQVRLISGLIWGVISLIAGIIVSIIASSE